MDITDANSKMDSQSAPACGAALLLVIGEPHSDEHKSLILAEVTKGFRCWDCDLFDINDELAQIANKADLGEEGPNGERIIRHRSSNLCCEILVNPQTQTVDLAVKNFLSTPTKYKHLIYAGHAFQGTGAWILQDDTYTFSNFSHTFKDQAVDNAVKQQNGCSLAIYTASEGSWTNGQITKNDFSKLLNVKLNPDEKLEQIHGVLQFTAYVGNFVKVRHLNELLQSTDVVGNIRFSRPTLYIFPGCQGDSALFGISGFNLLVNGGFSRRACFWDFTRHLDRIDAALMTHLGTDNLYGFSAVLQRKATENVHPEIGFMYLNVSDKLKAIEDGASDGKGDGTLMVNLADEGNKIVEYAKQIGQFPHPCSRSQSSQTVDPINLYHKVGIGSLDMYILNPITDSKELKDFYQQWNQRVAQFGVQQHVPLPNTLSVCALLVWRPSNPNDNITRIFFPGNAPQHKVLEGLEKLKNLDILKRAQCTKTSLATKPAPKKPVLGSKPPVPRSKVSPVQTPKQEVAKKEIGKTETKATPKPRPASAPKTKKEIINKKTSKESEKTDKNKSSTSSSPSKASTKSVTPSTPKEIVSPVQEPQPVQPVPAKEPEPAPAVDTAKKVEPPVTESADLLGLDSSVDPPALVAAMEPMAVKHEELEPSISDSPAPLPDPGYGQEQEIAAPPAALGRDQLLELGVYDEDQDIEEHLNAQPQPTDKISQMFGGMTDSMHADMQPAMSDLMTTSMHESMYDDRGQFGEQPQPQNGMILTPDDEDSEEIQPQALPEPMAYAPSSYNQEPDIIPNIPAKESSITLEPEPAAPYSEPDLLPLKQEQEDLDEQSTAKIEDDFSGANDFDDKHFADKEMESPEEISSKLPLDTELTTEAKEEKHLSEDEGFDQDHFKEEEVEEKDVTEESEKRITEDIVDEHDVQSTETESDKVMPESLTLVHDDEMKNVPMPESVIECAERNNVESFQLGVEKIKEEEQVLQEKSQVDTELFVSENIEKPDAQLSPTFGEEKDTGFEGKSEELEGIHLQKDTTDLESPNVSPIADIDKEDVIEDNEDMIQEAGSKIDDEIRLLDEEIQQKSLEPEENTLTQLIEPSVDQMQHTASEPSYGFIDQQSESPENLLEPDQDFNKELESPEPEFKEPPIPSNLLEPDQDFNKEFESPEHEYKESPISSNLLEPDQGFNKEFESPEHEYKESPVPSDSSEPDIIERPKTPEPERPQTPEPEIIETGKLLDKEFGSQEYEFRESPIPSDNIEPDIIERPKTPEPERPQTPEQDIIDAERTQTPEPDKIEAERTQTPEPDKIEAERPPTPQPDIIEAVENVAEEIHDLSHEGTPDSIEGQVEDKSMIENDFVGDTSGFDTVVKEQEGDSSTDEEKENVEPKEGTIDNQQLEATRDSLERDVMPGSSDLQDHRESVERDEEEEEEEDEDDDDDDSSEEEESQSTSYEEEEASDQKCLIQDSVSEDHKVNVFDNKGVELDSGAAGHLDSLGVDTQPSDSLLTPESEATDHSPGFAMDYHQIGELDDADSFAVHHDSSVPASQNFGQPSVGPEFNQFMGIDTHPLQPQHENPFDNSSDDEQAHGGPAGFDPLAEWGQPMGLPSPSPPDPKTNAATSDKKSPKGTKASELKKPEPKKAPGSAGKTKTATTATKAPKQSNGVPEKSKSRLSGVGTANPSRLSTGTSLNTSKLSTERKTPSKSRPASAPAKDKTDGKATANGTKRPATATGKSSASTVKMPPLPPFTPFYVDLTYIPTHGNPQYSDVEFFKRIRARYYVLSALSPNPQILDALVEAKKTWEDKELAVTIIPTYDNETLRHWMGLHKETLADMKIEVAPSASRCTIQLQDHETSSSAYRLEF